jgi:hypothetical protein
MIENTIAASRRSAAAPVDLHLGQQQSMYSV